MRRYLALREGTADKFWRIEVADAVVSVHYGRRGTRGQRSATTYPSSAAALAAATKQVDGKVAKGYQDAPAAEGAAIAADATVARVASAPRRTPASTTPTVESALRQDERTQGARPGTWADHADVGLVVSPFAAAMRFDSPVPTLTRATTFDPDAELERARRSAHLELTYARYESTSYDWFVDEPVFTEIPTPESVHWWRRLDTLDSHGSTDDALAIFAAGGAGRRAPHSDPSSIGARAAAAASESSADALVAKLAEPPSWRTDVRYGDWRDHYDPRLWWAFEYRALLRTCQPQTLAAVQAALPSPLPPLCTPHGSAHGYGHGFRLDASALVAAALGVRLDEVAERLDEYAEQVKGLDGWSQPAPAGVIASAAATVPERLALARRLGSTPELGPMVAQLWVVTTGREGLSTLMTWVEQSAWHQAAARSCLHAVAALLHGPGAVDFFARLAGTDLGAPIGRRWLRRHPDAVLASSVAAAQAGRIAATLRPLPSTDRRLGPATTSSLRSILTGLDAEDATPVFGSTGYPDWWGALNTAVGRRGKVPDWLDPTSLTPLMIDGHRLCPDDLAVVVRAAIAGHDDLVRGLAGRASSRSRDGLAIDLLEAWQAADLPARHKWVLRLGGLLGDDAYALRLGQLTRLWPGERAHQRALLGLDALEALGSDIALQQISLTASRVKFPALKTAAQRAMDRIAADRGLSRDQLEDRIVPDGGLDPRGRIRLDFGPRAFLVSLTPQAGLQIRDEGPDGHPAGRRRTGLPAANSADDPELVAAAKADLRLQRKNLTALARSQRTRFEQAMITGRRWSGPDHARFIAAHPVLRSLLEPVIWGIYDPQARLVGTCRLGEPVAHESAGTTGWVSPLIGIDDEPIIVPADHRLGIVHPIALDEATIAAWGEVLADFELLAPFPQLDRPVYRLDEQDPDSTISAALPTAAIEATRLLGALERGGWQRGDVGDGAVYCDHYLRFDALALTAVISYDGLTVFEPPTYQDPQTIDAVRLLRDPVTNHQGESASAMQVVPWSAAPAEVASEVLATLHAMASH